MEHYPKNLPAQARALLVDTMPRKATKRELEELLRGRVNYLYKYCQGKETRDSLERIVRTSFPLALIAAFEVVEPNKKLAIYGGRHGFGEVELYEWCESAVDGTTTCYVSFATKPWEVASRQCVFPSGATIQPGAR